MSGEGDISKLGLRSDQVTGSSAPQVSQTVGKVTKATSVVAQEVLAPQVGGEVNRTPLERQPVGAKTLFTSVKNAKQTEREIVYRALHNAVLGELRRLKLIRSYENEADAEITIKARLGEAYSIDKVTQESGKIAKNAIDREVERRLKKSPDLKKENLGKELEPLKKKMEAELQSSTFKKNYEELQAQVAKIAVMTQHIFKEDERDAQGEYNKDILYAIRKALENPAYKLLKEQESHPLVHFLHTLCLASYNEPKLMDAFKQLGQYIKKFTIQETNETPKTFSELLRASHDVGEKQGLNKVDRVTYLFERVQQMLGALFSYAIGRVLTLWQAPYDPRGSMGNNAGALYTEVLEKGGKQVQLRKIYTPSPTVGNEVSPEARAILQAMENRHFMNTAELAQEKYKQVCWVYTNLQNIASSNEGPRSKALMRLNEEYPFSCRASTISVDSELYIAGAHGSKEAIQKATHDTKPLDSAYKEEIIQALHNDNNFKIDDRGSPDFGYYFAVPEREQRDEFKKKLEKVVEHAYELVKSKTKPDKNVSDEKWNWQKKAAFRELVNLGVTRLLRTEALSVAENENFKDIDVEILDTEACKECIDRGGKANALMMWALSTGNRESPERSIEEDAVLAAMHSRALLGRFRLILPARIEPMFVLTNCCTQSEICEYLNQICRDQKVEPRQRASTSFTPFRSLPPEPITDIEGA